MWAASPKRIRAYTLVERLVVMAIIVILASLSTVGILAGLRAGKVSACASNLSSLFKSLRLYETDHNGFDPPYTTFRLAPNGLDRTRELTESLTPYGMTRDAWFCPLDRFAHTDHRSNEQGNSHLSLSYAHTAAILPPWTPKPDGSFSFRLSTVPDPANFVYYRDIPELERDDLGNAIWTSAHGENASHLFGDGHTKQVPAP